MYKRQVYDFSISNGHPKHHLPIFHKKKLLIFSKDCIIYIYIHIYRKRTDYLKREIVKQWVVTWIRDRRSSSWLVPSTASSNTNIDATIFIIQHMTGSGMVEINSCYCVTSS